MRCKDTNKRGQKQTQFVFCRAGVSWAQPKRMNKRGQKQTQFAFCRAGVSWAEPKRMNKRRFGLPAFAESSRKADATSQTSAGRSFAARRPASCVPSQAAPRAMCISGLSQQESNSRGGRLARNSRKARAVPSQAAARVHGLLPQNRPRKRSAARSRPLAEGCHSPNGSQQAPPLGRGPLQQSQGSAEHAPQLHNRPRKRSAGRSLPLRRPAV